MIGAAGHEVVPQPHGACRPPLNLSNIKSRAAAPHTPTSIAAPSHTYLDTSPSTLLPQYKPSTFLPQYKPQHTPTSIPAPEHSYLTSMFPTPCPAHEAQHTLLTQRGSSNECARPKVMSRLCSLRCCSTLTGRGPAPATRPPISLARSLRPLHFCASITGSSLSSTEQRKADMFT